MDAFGARVDPSWRRAVVQNLFNLQHAARRFECAQIYISIYQTCVNTVAELVRAG